jgi:serine/threonine protein kinase
MTQDLTGQTFDNYRIDSLLGSGGMGQVYRSTHLLLNRQAAIKVMHPHLAADPSFQARFLQEAKASADLDHPNIVQIYDFGENDGQLYLVMELIDGGSLRNLLPNGQATPTSIYTALELIAQAADGLGYAHTRGMVHRDIKPDNLLLKKGANGNGYTIKIGDFGLASLAESSVKTMSGVTMGTPAYMSPEQAQGNDLDGRSDIYSLGVVLYELATGYLPFDARTLTDAVYKHVFVTPTSPRQANPNISAGVDQIILRCLEKNPDARYASAIEMAGAVRTEREQIDSSTVIPATEVGHRGTTTNRPLVAETVMDKPGARAPSSVPALTGSSRAPRLQILRQSGEQLHAVELTGNGLTLGRFESNDVVLDDEAVSRYHLRIDWDGSRVAVTDLGSRNGTLIDGNRLLPQVSQTWGADSWLQIGPFWIRLSMPAGRSTQETAAFIAREETANPDSGRIQVSLDQTSVSIVPGQPQSVNGTLANLGNKVDHLQISVDGIPAEWVRTPQQEVQLNPGAQAPLFLQINVSRSPESYAGQYPVVVRARSRENPEESGSAQAIWQVQGFADSKLVINPARAGGRTTAGYRLGLTNAGNETARFGFRGQDDEEALEYQFKQERVELAAGESMAVPLTVRAPRRWVGNAVDRSFQVRALPAAGQPQSINAQMQHKAVIPTWSVPLIGFALVGLAFLINMLLTPTIQAFELDRSEAEYAAGDPVTLSWIVNRARTIDIEVLPDGLVLAGTDEFQPRAEYSFTPTWTGEQTVRLIAKSWLKTREEVVRISVLPPDPDAPDIELFSIEPSSVTQGESVTISWNVANADSVILELPDGTSRDGLPSQGQLPDTPAQTGAYILKASNGGISATPQLLQVQVGPLAEVPENDDAGAGNGEGEGEGDDSPELPPPAPTIAIQPTETIELVEGACYTLSWDLQNIEDPLLDGEPIDPADESIVCPESSTTFVWEMTGLDGEPYDVSRTINVSDEMDIDEPAVVDDFIGEWKNSGFGNDFGITRIEVEDAGSDEVTVQVYVRCASPSECHPEQTNLEHLADPSISLLGLYGIDLGTDTIEPESLPKLHASYTRDSENFHLSLGVKDDDLVVRIYYVEPGLLHEFTLQPPGPPAPESVYSRPEKFTEDPLYEAP